MKRTSHLTLDVSEGRNWSTHGFSLGLVGTFFSWSVEVRNSRRICHEILQFLGIRRAGEDGSELVDGERSLNERCGKFTVRLDDLLVCNMKEQQ